MFVFHIYTNFEAEGHCRDQGDFFYQLKTIVSFNSGKIKMKNSYNYCHITMKTLSEMQKCNHIVYVFVKKKNVPRKIILVHKSLPILFNAFDSVLLYYRTVKRLLIPTYNGKIVLLFFNQNLCCGHLKGPIEETVLLKTKYTLFNVLLRETS